MTDIPFVSVIIVNYNGKQFLTACLDALRNQTYPADSFEVIISDNASSDGSVDLLKGHFSWVRVLENKSNLGFAAGNNVAINSSKGEFIVLLNNDTVPQPTWLDNLVKVAKENPLAGIVTGRLHLFYDQLTLELQSETFIPPGDGRELGIQLYSIDSETPFGVTQYLDGFYGFEPSSYGGTFRWTKSRAILGVPVPPGSGSWNVSLQLAAFRPDNQSVPLQISIKNNNPNGIDLIYSGSVSGAEPQTVCIEIPAALRSQSLPVLQNTGSIVFRDGASRDRGTYVREYEVLYETDTGQYSTVEEVFSGCGANLLLSKKMLDEIGLFDDDFFMYYEDTDLSWRARLAGWKVLYAPEATVRHIHCGTSKEWSPFFLFLVERNRLAMVVKNGSSSQILWTLSKYLGRAALNTFAAIRAYAYRLPHRQELARWPRHHARVLNSLIGRSPSFIRKRIHIQKNRKILPSMLKSWFVE